MSNEPLSAALADALDGVLPRMAFLQYGQFFGDDPDFDIEAYYLRVAESLIKEHPDLFAARASRPEPKDATPEPCGFCGRSREACESWRYGVWPCCGLCDHAKRADGAQEWTITEPAASRPEPKDATPECAHEDEWFDRTVCGCGSMHNYCVACSALRGDCSLAAPAAPERLPLNAARVPVFPPDPEGLPRIRMTGAQLADSGANVPPSYFLDADEHDDFIPASALSSPASAPTAALDVERLARALHRLDFDGKEPSVICPHRRDAAAIAREYAALASNQDTEGEREGEKP